MKKILICDDSETELLRLFSILENAGCVTTKLTDATKLLQLAKKNKPDMIFLDIVMPEKDGYATCRELTSDASTKDIPIIFVSSKGKKADRVWAQMQGAKGLIQKPYEDQHILDALATY